MTIYGIHELILETRSAADIWIELHRTIRESDFPVTRPEHPFDLMDALKPSERELYDALTKRFIEGLTK